MLVIADVRGEPPVRGDLFAGKKFWIAQRCPMRSDFIKRVIYNGGEVVPLEKQADYLIIDGARTDLPPGGITYKFIEESIKQSQLLDPEGFRKGPPVGSVREAGSAQATRVGRTPFTIQDDIELYNWVRDCETSGAPTQGNSIYKELERRNPRHTWQSWRDRYVKKLRQKPPKTVSANPPPSPPSDPQPTRSSHQTETVHKNARRFPEVRVSSKSKQRRVSPSPSRAQSPTHEPQSPPARTQHAQPDLADFSLVYFDTLLSAGDTIMKISYGQISDAWKSWANSNPAHTAENWAWFFDSCVRPVWKDLSENEARSTIYDEAWKEWSVQHGEDGMVSEWLEFYRENVFPKFPPQAEEPDDEPEIKEKPAIPPIGEPNGASQTQGQDTEQTDIERAEVVLQMPELEPREVTPVSHEQQSSIVLGKRGREDDDLQENSNVATPSPKRRNTATKVTSGSIYESIEASPTKIPFESTHDVVSITSSQLTSSSSLPPDTPPPASQQQQSPPEITIYDESQEGGESQVSEHRVREALDGLFEVQLFDLLATLRDLPYAPEEADDMTLLDILVMHLMRFLNEERDETSQAAWDVGQMLADFGVMERLFEEEGEDQGVEEQEDLEEQLGEDQDEELEQHSEVAEADARVERDPAEDVPSDSLETEIYRSPTPRERDPKRRPASAATTRSSQKQQTRPASSSGGTAITSFEMPADPIYDIKTEAQAESYIASRVAPPYNFPLDHVISAFHATGANSTATADAVLQWMRTNAAGGDKKGRRSSVGFTMLPDEAGVWTREDDEALEGLTMERRRVEQKHGRSRCRRRREFLAQLEE